MTMAPKHISVTQWNADGGCMLTFAVTMMGDAGLGFVKVSLTAAQVEDLKARLERPADR
jgi:hypothetical protein